MTHPRPASAEEGRAWNVLAVAVVILALGLRVALALHGGQGFWPDEGRYHAAVEALDQFREGHSRLAWLTLIGGADHMLFKVVCLAPAWADAHFGPSQARAAIYLGLFSTASIILIGRCARAAGAGRREAALAVLVAALSSSLFYYTRHLFPYDVSLTLCLIALRLTLGPPTRLKAVLAGVFSAIGFLCYDGYWVLAGMILTAYVLSIRPADLALRKAGWAIAGLVAPLVAAAIAARQCGGDLVASFLTFSGTINQGDFGQGHRFVWEYLGDAEGPLLLLWLACAAYALFMVVGRGARGRPLLWLLIAGLLYAALCVCADVLRIFVVYGRTARTLVPFFCLLTAWALDKIWERRPAGPAIVAAILAVVAGIAAPRLATPFAQVFPARFQADAAALSAKGSTHLLRLVNANRLPGGTFVTVDKPYRVLLARANPLQFAPYLYEGISQEQRHTFLTHDISMRLLEMTGVPLPFAPGAYPGALRLKVRFPKARTGYTEPIVTAGEAGRADFLAVRYIDPKHVRFAYDSWGSGGFVSDPVPIAEDAEHELIVFMGSMLAPDRASDSGEIRAHNARLRNDVLVVIDGTVAVAAHLPSHATEARSIAIGANFIGGSTSSDSFEGVISSVSSVSREELTGYLPWVRVSNLSPGPLWEGYTGPLRLHLTLPEIRRTGAEPVITTGRDSSDSLSLIYADDGKFRVQYRHSGAAPVVSRPLAVPSDRKVDLTVSLGSLMPPASSALYAATPALLALSDRVWVRVNGETVLAKSAATYPCGPSDTVILANLAGVPSVATYFTGRLEAIEAVPPLKVIGQLPLATAGSGAQAATLDGHTGPLQLTILLPEGKTARQEPLLTSGTEGAGDFVYARMIDPSHVVLGIDHWGTGSTESAVITLRSSKPPHELLISTGALLPVEGSEVYQRHPQWKDLAGRVVLVLDGRVVLNTPVPCFPAKEEDIAIGFNAIGGSTTATLFSGAIVQTRSVSPDTVREFLTASR